MLYFSRAQVWALLLGAWGVAPVFSATPSIGTASARGSMRIDGSRVEGNATLFDGTVVETERATTALRLTKGVEIRLGNDSRGTLYRDRMVLEKGTGEMAASRFTVEANTLRIEPFEPNSRGVVSMNGSKVGVAALAGSLQVTTGEGVLLARLHPGTPLEFEPQAAGATAPIKVSGVIKKQDSNYYLTGENGVTYQVSGKNLESMVGKRVTITGSPDPGVIPAAGATSALVVTGVKVISAGAVGAMGGGVASSTAGGAAAGGAVAGSSAVGTAAGGLAAAVGAHAALIAGVAVAAGAGLSVGVYESTKDSASTQ